MLFKRISIALLLCCFAVEAQAQALANLVGLYVSQFSLKGEWSTCQIGDGPDHICTWDTDKLGPQPTIEQLQALVPTWANMEKGRGYAEIVSKGVEITCSISATVCTSDITGTYSIPVADADQRAMAAQANITSIETAVAAGRGLPGGGSTFAFFDASGKPHSFNQTQWEVFATAMMYYSYQLQLVKATLLSGNSADWPAAVITLN